MSATNSNQPQNLNDHVLRSKLVFELISPYAATPTLSPGSDARIPRLLFQFWNDHNNLPEDVRDCIESWGRLTRLGFDRLLFDHFTARSFIEQNYSSDHLAAYERCHHPAMQCDYFRLCFLLMNGGAYVDADEQFLGDADFAVLFNNSALKLQPLCFDLGTTQMVPASQFMNQPYDRDRIYYFNNNPIIARRGDPVIYLALQRATGKLLTSRLSMDIQATTGPGNITESVLLSQLGQYPNNGVAPNFRPLFEWDDVSISKWPLSYRDDERNWRNWKLP